MSSSTSAQSTDARASVKNASSEKAMYIQKMNILVHELGNSCNGNYSEVDLKRFILMYKRTGGNVLLPLRELFDVMLQFIADWNSTLAKEAESGAIPSACTICLDPLDDPATRRTLECSHMFHGECVRKWKAAGDRKNKKTCPLCKADVL